jgi:general L-amino acid transport system permease protein
MNFQDLSLPLQPLIQNFELLFGGRYPQEQMWRPLLTCALVLLSIFSLSISILSLKTKLVLTIISLIFINFVYLGIGSLAGILPPVNSAQLGGLSLTLYLFYHAVILSLLPGVLLALGRSSKIVSLRAVCTAYIEGVRAVPLITLLFVGHFLFPYFAPLNSEPISEIERLVVCYVMFSSAYSAEIWRGAFLTVPHGLLEASKSLGFTQGQTFRFIQVPVAFRNALPGLVANAIGLLKDSSLVSTLGVFDLLGVARLIPRQPEWLGHSFVPLAFVTLVYLILGYALSKRFQKIEPKWST